MMTWTRWWLWRWRRGGRARGITTGSSNKDAVGEMSVPGQKKKRLYIYVLLACFGIWEFDKFISPFNVVNLQVGFLFCFSFFLPQREVHRDST